MKRRSLVLLPFAGAAGAWMSPLRAQSAWPDKPIHLVVPFAAGTGPDLLSRKLAEKLPASLGQSVIVDNKVGAGGAIGAELVVQAPPDGYTLMLGASTHVTQKLLSPQFRFDPLTQFVHITRVAFSPSILVVAASSPYKSVRDIVEAAKREPGKLNYASGGIGTAAHLAGAAIASAMQLEMVHVPYRGSADILQALVTGDTQFGVPIAATALPLVAQGKLRALATTGAQRMRQLPDVPTLNEALGRDNLVFDAWSGVWAPAGTPKAVVDKVNAAVLKALAEPDLREAYEKGGAEVAPTRIPEEFTHFVLAETARYAKLVATARIGA